MTNWRIDANGISPELASFTKRQLEYVRTEVLLKEPAPLTGREVIPQGTDIPAYKDFYVHEMYEMLGVAEFIADAADDLPLADVGVSEETFNARSFGCAYKHTFEEMEKSQAEGMNITTKRANAARRAIEELMNQIMWFGSPTEDLFGFVNFPDVPRVLLNHAIGPTVSQSNIRQMLNSFINDTFKITKQNAMPDTLGMATDPYTHIHSEPRSQDNNTTIADYLKDKNPFLSEIKPIREFDGAGPNGEDLIAVLDSREDTVEHKLFREFTQRPPQTDNLATVTNCVAKSGGTVFNYPMRAAIGEVPAA